jgi:hypothetical protein
MSNRKHKLPPDKTLANFAYRVGKVSAELPAKDQPLRLVLASEKPVRVWDYQNWEVVDEVLRMDGLQFSGQVPLLNSHNRDEARSVVGSIRELSVAGDRLEGQAYFASNDEAQQIRELYDEGHLTDFSIGFQADEVMNIKRGEKTTIKGREYTGPIRVVTKATVKEGSAVAIGADDQAKALREYPILRAYMCPDSCYEDYLMTQNRDFCLSRGMPADTPDDQILTWMELNLRSAAEDPVEEEKEETNVEDEKEKGVAAERARAAEITQLCGARNISQAQCASYIRSSMSAGDVAKDIIRKESHKPARTPTTGDPLGGFRMSAMESEDDKFADGAKGALINRCLMGINLERAEQHAKGIYRNFDREETTHFRDQSALEGLEEIKRLLTTPVARDFRNLGLYEIARAFVQRDSVNRRGLMNRDITFGRSRSEIVRDALALDMHYRDSDAAYHVTGSFSNVLLDAAKKTLLAAYEEANVTYPIWTRQAPSTVDFKTINRMRLGEIPDPDIVPENGIYGETTTTDSKESYRVEKYGHIFSISLEAIVNDDLNAISRIPAQQGYAMRRKINKLVYSVLTANAALSDGVALFHSSSHGANLDTTALSTAALNVGWTIMAVQTGLTTGVILNIQPRFLLVPPSLSATALRIAGSLADPSNTAGSTEDAARPNYNSGTLNLYGPNGSRPLTPVVDACISSSESATAWYLAAEPNQIDTVEVCFLQGEETPFLDREDGFSVDAVRYKIRQTFGAKAIDYRGLYQGNA